MAKGASGRSLARPPRPQVFQRHPRVAKGAFDWSLARGPCPQVLQRHPRVAKVASGRSSARRVGPQVSQRHPVVSKGRESLPLQGLWSSLRPGSARHPRLQVVLRQGRVAKRASIGTLARGPLPQALQGHPRVAKVTSGRSSARCRRDRTQVRDMRQGAASVKGCRRVSMEGRRQGLQASKAAGVLQKIEGVKGVRRGVKRCVKGG